MYLPFVLPRPVVFPAKAEYFQARGPVGRIWAAYLRSTNQLEINRDGARSAQETLDAAVEILRAGELFGFYPEGTRSPDGKLYRGRSGLGYLALNSGAPVIPVAMLGTRKMMPPGRNFLVPAKIEIRIGQPLTFPDLADVAPAKARREIADRVMAAIRELSGQEYVHMYASDRKAELVATTKKPKDCRRALSALGVSARAQAEQLDRVVDRGEAGLGGYLLGPLLDGAALDLDAAAADPAGQVVMVDRAAALAVEDLTRRVADGVHRAGLAEHLQVPVDGGQPDGLAAAAQLGVDLLGAAEAGQAGQRGGQRGGLLRPAHPRAPWLLVLLLRHSRLTPAHPLTSSTLAGPPPASHGLALDRPREAGELPTENKNDYH